MNKKIKITESQWVTLVESLEAQDNFLAESVKLSRMIQEGSGAELLQEGLVDSFRKVMAKGGFINLRKAIAAAVTAGALAGVSEQALAQAATQAGATPEQSREVAMLVRRTPTTGPTAGMEKGGNSAKTMEFAKELTKLNQRYVIDDNDPAKTKQFMRFKGNIADVVGIEPKNGYPIFAKGSQSETRLVDAFKNPKIVNGIVNVRGKDFQGSFLEHDGLWYTVQQNADKPKETTPPEVVATTGAGASTATPTSQENTEIIDFTGLWQGAEQSYKENRAPAGTAMRKPQEYGSKSAYAAEFFRQSDPGFKGMTDDEIFDMFDHGLKAKVVKGKFKMGGKWRPALNPQR